MNQETDTAERETRARIDSIFGSAPPSAVTTAPAAPDTATTRVKRGLLRWARTAAITLGVMYVVGWFVAVGAVSGLTNRFWRPSVPTNVLERIATSAPALAYRLPVDPNITPDQAGVALARLMPEPTNRPKGFTYRDVGERPSAPWRLIPLPPGLFTATRMGGGELPSEQHVLGAVRRGLTPTQRQALRMIGTAPIWRDYDLIARARAADLIGGRLKLPFDAGAQSWGMPLPSFAATRELAIAAVSRAAWHMSEGRMDSAEVVLRGIISVGAVMVENAPNTIETIIGSRIVNDGTQALVRFYDLRGDPRGKALTAATEQARKAFRYTLPTPERRDEESIRRAFLALAQSADAPRGVRFEALPVLSFASCGTFRGVAFGDDGTAREAAEMLRRDVARYEGERAALGLIGRTIDETIPSEYLVDLPQGASVIATVSRLYFNPRIANCLLGPGMPSRFR